MRCYLIDHHNKSGLIYQSYDFLASGKKDFRKVNSVTRKNCCPTRHGRKNRQNGENNKNQQKKNLDNVSTYLVPL